MRLLQPPVDLVARAFRATKGGSDERETTNPIWNAIQSAFSAMEAAKRRAVNTTKSFTADFASYRFEPDELVRSIAFDFDAELARRVFFHPVIFCKSRLFNIESDLSDVRSARIFVRDLDFDFKYVDLVQFDSAEEYIGLMLSHFEKQAYACIRKTWDRLEKLQWQPGQASRQLARALGLSRRPKIKSRPRTD